jgi:hypothetical protein
MSQFRGSLHAVALTTQPRTENSDVRSFGPNIGHTEQSPIRLRGETPATRQQSGCGFQLEGATPPGEA